MAAVGAAAAGCGVALAAGAPLTPAVGVGVAVGLIAMILFSLRAEDRKKYAAYRRRVLSLAIMKDLARLSIPSDRRS